MATSEARLSLLGPCYPGRVSVERLVSICEHAMTVLRTSAVEFRKSGDLADAGICEVTARALEVELRNVFAAPHSSDLAEPPQGTYLSQLQSSLGLRAVGPRGRGAFASTELVEWLVEALLEGREHVLALRDPAELFATDIEVVAAADRWVDKVDQGPPITRPPGVPTPTPPPFPKVK